MGFLSRRPSTGVSQGVDFYRREGQEKGVWIPNVERGRNPKFDGFSEITGGELGQTDSSREVQNSHGGIKEGQKCQIRIRSNKHANIKRRNESVHADDLARHPLKYCTPDA